MISQILNSIQPTSPLESPRLFPGLFPKSNRKRVTVALPRSILKSAKQLGHHGFTQVYSRIHKALGSPHLYPGLFPHSQGTWVTMALPGSIPIITITHDVNLSIRLHNRV
ncbi:hypothetical protein RHGRI_017497 [Rhododendron griersonianum]|uniref:Uncharacterized protein n=1 Tax=Rhododendron griersonianum TaxID=479676 RepID=A0AAV6JXZ4_9ERIC|nr:hypothetical protein RHGRI_017497 [Rhododendron griersonianum]